MRGKRWEATHTAQLAYFRGKGWPAWRIARKIGFCLKTVQRRLACLGIAAPPGPQRVGLDLQIVGGYALRNGEWRKITQIEIDWD